MLQLDFQFGARSVALLAGKEGSEPLHGVVDQASFHSLDLLVGVEAGVLLVAPGPGTAAMGEQIARVADLDDVVHGAYSRTITLGLPWYDLAGLPLNRAVSAGLRAR